MEDKDAKKKANKCVNCSKKTWFAKNACLFFSNYCFANHKSFSLLRTRETLFRCNLQF